MTDIVVVALVCAAFAGVVFVQAREHRAQRAEWSAEKRDLLGRLMAKDYAEFRAHEPKPIQIIAAPADDKVEREYEHASDLAHGLA